MDETLRANIPASAASLGASVVFPLPDLVTITVPAVAPSDTAPMVIVSAVSTSLIVKEPVVTSVTSPSSNDWLESACAETNGSSSVPVIVITTVGGTALVCPSVSGNV